MPTPTAARQGNEKLSLLRLACTLSTSAKTLSTYLQSEAMA